MSEDQSSLIPPAADVNKSARSDRPKNPPGSVAPGMDNIRSSGGSLVRGAGIILLSCAAPESNYVLVLLNFADFMLVLHGTSSNIMRGIIDACIEVITPERNVNLGEIKELFCFTYVFIVTNDGTMR